MRLLFIRHADPDYEKDYLTEKGLVEAKCLNGRILKDTPDFIYCSPLGRAKATAEISLDGTGKRIETCDFLKEFNYRIDASSFEPTKPNHLIWDMKPEYWTEVDEYFSKDKWFTTKVMKDADIQKYYDYVCNELDKVLAKHGYVREKNYYRVEKANRDTLAFYCHFGIETVLLSHLINTSPIQLLHGFTALPSSVTTLYSEERDKGYAYFRCCGYGDLSHLYANGKRPSFSARFCEIYDSDERHD